MIEGDWKLIFPAAWNESDALPELFNLASDPFEEANLANRDPRRLAQMAKQLDTWWAPKWEKAASP